MHRLWAGMRVVQVARLTSAGCRQSQINAGWLLINVVWSFRLVMQVIERAVLDKEAASARGPRSTYYQAGVIVYGYIMCYGTVTM